MGSKSLNISKLENKIADLSYLVFKISLVQEIMAKKIANSYREPSLLKLLDLYKRALILELESYPELPLHLGALYLAFKPDSELYYLENIIRCDKDGLFLLTPQELLAPRDLEGLVPQDMLTFEPTSTVRKRYYPKPKGATKKDTQPQARKKAYYIKNTKLVTLVNSITRMYQEYNPDYDRQAGTGLGINPLLVYSYLYLNRDKIIECDRNGHILLIKFDQDSGLLKEKHFKRATGELTNDYFKIQHDYPLEYFQDLELSYPFRIYTKL